MLVNTPSTIAQNPTSIYKISFLYLYYITDNTLAINQAEGNRETRSIGMNSALSYIESCINQLWTETTPFTL